MEVVVTQSLNCLRVLAITPTLGRSAWLDETVSSIRALPLDIVHVLVAPQALISQLATRFPGIRVIPEQGNGMYAAINAGLSSVSDYDAFTYINDDDLLLPNFGRAVEEVINGHNRSIIAYGGVRLIGGDGRRLGTIPISRYPSMNRMLYGQRIEPVYQHGTIVSRGALAHLKGYDETLRYCGDSEFLARACIQGVRFMHVAGGPLAAFRLRAGQLSKNRRALLDERAFVDAKLQLRAAPHTLRDRWARWIFRVTNIPAYVERIARHGPLSFDELIGRFN